MHPLGNFEGLNYSFIIILSDVSQGCVHICGTLLGVPYAVTYITA